LEWWIERIWTVKLTNILLDAILNEAIDESTCTRHHSPTVLHHMFSPFDFADPTVYPIIADQNKEAICNSRYPLEVLPKKVPSLFSAKQV
jgi:hypothetical protein